MSEIGPGTVLGQYRILEPIGSGGMATVYKGYHPSLDRHVAVKVLPARYAGEPAFLERFRQEARTVARLRHPNILEVYDFGEQDGVTYIVNGYMEGGTLASRIGVPMRLDVVIPIATQVAAGLDYAHARGVLHRDIKPSNIFISGDGTAVIGDFGLAKILEGAKGLTQAGTVLGTPEYMSPEQALGKPLDPRTDVYSLGVVLYVMLVGTVPYSVETPLATMLAHVHRPIPMPRSLNRAIPEQVESVLVKALAKNAEERYASAGELSRALATSVGAATIAVPASGAYQGEEPTGAMPSSPLPLSPPPVPSTPPVLLSEQKPLSPAETSKGMRRWAVPAAVAGIVVLGAFAAFLALSPGRSGSPPAVPAPPPAAAPAPPAVAPVVGGEAGGAPIGSDRPGPPPSAVAPEPSPAEPVAVEPQGALPVTETGLAEPEPAPAEAPVAAPSPAPPRRPIPSQPAAAPRPAESAAPSTGSQPAPEPSAPAAAPAGAGPSAPAVAPMGAGSGVTAPSDPAAAPVQPAAQPPSGAPVAPMGAPTPDVRRPPPEAPPRESAPSGGAPSVEGPQATGPPALAPEASPPGVPIIPMGAPTPTPSEPLGKRD